jgi:hypothetical protein
MTPSLSALAARVLKLLAAHERAERATPGPWEWRDWPSPNDGTPGDALLGEGGYGVAWFDKANSPVEVSRANGDQIAHARTDLPAAHRLIAELLDVIALSERLECHDYGCAKTGTRSSRQIEDGEWDKCDCGHDHAADAMERFMTPEWREVAEALRRKKEKSDAE